MLQRVCYLLDGLGEARDLAEQISRDVCRHICKCQTREMQTQH